MADLTVKVGQQVQFTLLVTNSGQSGTEIVEATDVFDPDFVFSEITSTNNVDTVLSSTESEVQFRATLAEDESASLTYVGTFNAVGEHTNTASITKVKGKTNSSSAQSSYSRSVLVESDTINCTYATSTSAGSSSVGVGESVTFYLTITNNSQSTIGDVDISCSYNSAEFTVTSDSPSNGYQSSSGVHAWDGMTISGGTNQYALTGTWSSGGQKDVTWNVDYPASYGNVDETFVSFVTVVSGADIAITSEAEDTTPIVGSDYEYRFRVDNPTGVSQSNIDVKAVFDSDFTPKSGSITGGGVYDSINNECNWTAITIPSSGFEAQLDGAYGASGVHYYTTRVYDAADVELDSSALTISPEYATSKVYIVGSMDDPDSNIGNDARDPYEIAASVSHTVSVWNRGTSEGYPGALSGGSATVVVSINDWVTGDGTPSISATGNDTGTWDATAKTIIWTLVDPLADGIERSLDFSFAYESAGSGVGIKDYSWELTVSNINGEENQATYTQITGTAYAEIIDSACGGSAYLNPETLMTSLTEPSGDGNNFTTTNSTLRNQDFDVSATGITGDVHIKKASITDGESSGGLDIECCTWVGDGGATPQASPGEGTELEHAFIVKNGGPVIVNGLTATDVEGKLFMTGNNGFLHTYGYGAFIRDTLVNPSTERHYFNDINATNIRNVYINKGGGINNVRVSNLVASGGYTIIKLDGQGSWFYPTIGGGDQNPDTNGSKYAYENIANDFEIRNITATGPSSWIGSGNYHAVALESGWRNGLVDTVSVSNAVGRGLVWLKSDNGSDDGTLVYDPVVVAADNSPTGTALSYGTSRLGHHRIEDINFDHLTGDTISEQPAIYMIVDGITKNIRFNNVHLTDCYLDNDTSPAWNNWKVKSIYVVLGDGHATASDIYMEDVTWVNLTMENAQFQLNAEQGNIKDCSILGGTFVRNGAANTACPAPIPMLDIREGSGPVNWNSANGFIVDYGTFTGSGISNNDTMIRVKNVAGGGKPPPRTHFKDCTFNDAKYYFNSNVTFSGCIAYNSDVHFQGGASSLPDGLTLGSGSTFYAN